MILLKRSIKANTKLLLSLSMRFSVLYFYFAFLVFGHSVGTLIYSQFLKLSIWMSDLIIHSFKVIKVNKLIIIAIIIIINIIIIIMGKTREWTERNGNKKGSQTYGNTNGVKMIILLNNRLYLMYIYLSPYCMIGQSSGYLTSFFIIMYKISGSHV